MSNCQSNINLDFAYQPPVSDSSNLDSDYQPPASNSSSDEDMILDPTPPIQPNRKAKQKHPVNLKNQARKHQPPVSDSINSDSEYQPPASDSSSDEDMISDTTPSIQQPNQKAKQKHSVTLKKQARKRQPPVSDSSNSDSEYQPPASNSSSDEDMILDPTPPIQPNQKAKQKHPVNLKNQARKHQPPVSDSINSDSEYQPPASDSSSDEDMISDTTPSIQQPNQKAKQKHPVTIKKQARKRQPPVSDSSNSDSEYQPPASDSSSDEDMISDTTPSIQQPNQKAKQKRQVTLKKPDRKRRKYEISVKATKGNDGGRTWDKVHYCLYCKKANLKIARHLERKHKSESNVAYAFSFPTGSKRRKMLLECLRNKGDWEHNKKVLEEGHGEIVTWKQPSKKGNVKDYLPCQHCFAMLKRSELWRHEKACRNCSEEQNSGAMLKKGKKSIQKASSRLLPISHSTEGLDNLIHNMRHDEVTSQIRTDEMIINYGNSLYSKKGREQSQHAYIAQKMRELGRFVLAAKDIDKTAHGLKDLCDPTKFDLVIKAARRVSEYTSSTKEYGKPSTAVKIRFSLKAATEAWIGHCLITSDVLREKKAKKFKTLLETSWSSYVSVNAHSTLEQRKWNKEDCVPLTEDVIALQNYLQQVEEEAKEALKKHPTSTAYKLLSECLLAQVIVFNKKREGEASRLTMETYMKADTGPVNKDIYETLSPVEQQMSHRLTRVVTRGKRGRKVPILLTERTKTSIDFLIEMRSEVGVLDENPYVFARIGTTTNIRGCDCLRKFAEDSKANNPELLRSTKLRKHVATLCQLLDLNNQELEQLARFMGHDIRVHCDYYRQTNKTFQVAKIGKLLFALESGAGSLKGKDFKTLDSVVSAQESNSKTEGLKKKSATANPKLFVDGGGNEILSDQPRRRTEKMVTRVIEDSGDFEDDGESDDEEVELPFLPRKSITRHAGEDGGREQSVLQSVQTKDGAKSYVTQSPCPVKAKMRTKQGVAAADCGTVKTKGKTPWTQQEKMAVHQEMSSFVALRKVPGKQECTKCIENSSPALQRRTWREVKYFVHNEIMKIKKTLKR